MVIDLEFLSDFNSYLVEKKAEGKKVIAFMAHDNIPEELIDAAGFIPLKMIFAGNDELMDASHNFLPPSTCSFAQSCIGLFSQKPNNYDFLDKVDYILVSNHCVSDICASEIIAKYFFIPRINFYTSIIQTENGLKYFKLELLELKKELESIKKSEISAETIKDSIRKYNILKTKLSEISQLTILGSKKLDIYQKAMLYGPDYIPKLEKFIEETKENQEISNNTKDLIFTGCSIFFGDYLNDLIEESGGNVVLFDSWVGLNYFSQIINEEKIDSTEDPMDLFIERFKNNENGDHTVPNYLENKTTQIEDFIKDYYQKTGKNISVVNHIIKFCDHINIFQSLLKSNLQGRGIKVLNLERDYSRANRGQISTRIEAFMEMM